MILYCSVVFNSNVLIPVKATLCLSILKETTHVSVEIVNKCKLFKCFFVKSIIKIYFSFHFCMDLQAEVCFRQHTHFTKCIWIFVAKY